jgi:16S rRNA processing protein RimM
MHDEEFVRIAVITGAHGLSGRLKIQVTSDITERFEKNKSVFIKIEGEFQKFRILNYIPREDRTGLLELKGIAEINRALLLKGFDIYIDKAETEKTRNSVLEEESYYYYDIIGCEVYYKGGLFGSVREIMETGAAEVLVIENGAGKDYMVPFVELMVDTAEIRSKKLTIHPVEGLIDV